MPTRTLADIFAMSTPAHLSTLARNLDMEFIPMGAALAKLLEIGMELPDPMGSTL